MVASKSPSSSFSSLAATAIDALDRAVEEKVEIVPITGDNNLYMATHSPISPTTANSGNSLMIDRYSITRRTAIFIVLAAIHYLLVVDWHSAWIASDHQASSNVNGNNVNVAIHHPPIRGGVDIRPIGEVCGEGPQGPLRINNRYAIIFDAGSTGSRVHIYEFQFCGPLMHTLVDEVFEEVKPGLSAYHKEPLAAAQSLQPLIQTALKRVPNLLHKCTPLTVKATAGLRLLPKETVREILMAVHGHLSTHAFLLAPNVKEGGAASVKNELEGAAAVAVIDGSEEANCAWITVNFLLSRLRETGLAEIGLREETPHHSKRTSSIPVEETAVVMDLGGGSTQIVFAVKADDGINYADHSRYYSQVRLNGQEYFLYQHSYLGYGLMEARKRIKKEHVQKMLPETAKDHSILRFPCYPTGFREKIEMPSGKSYELVGDGAGWDACMAVVMTMFPKDHPCILPPCTFNGVHQPSIVAKQYVAFSYFFDRIIPLGLTSPLTPFAIEREGRRLCQGGGTAAGGHRFAQLLEENAQWCLDLVYIYALLRVGFGLDIDQSITITKQINGYEAGWSLGAAIKLLEETSPCNHNVSLI